MHLVEQSPAAAKPMHGIEVKIAMARLQNIETKRVFTGTVEPIETVTLTSRVMGQIRQLTAEEGDRVNAGNPLVVIDVADISAQGNQAVAGVSMA